MFAGAAREAVFAQPEVIARVKAGFVPVALKAALINQPPRGPEGRLYGEIGRSKIAPQGICVVNSAGKVLDWVLMFDDDESVLAFLDHCTQQFARYPDARQAVAAERYMKYPSGRLEDADDTRELTQSVERHAPGTHCPASPPLPRGTVVARVFGRALGADDKPVADTRRQEHYVEDRFHVPIDLQNDLAEALANAGTRPFPLPDQLARLLVSHAYLGQLDVNPLGAHGGKGELRHSDFRSRRVGNGSGPTSWIRVEGTSEAAGGLGDGDRNDGRLWRHEVKLAWEGWIETRDRRITRLLVGARGSEKLKWDNASPVFERGVDVSFLPAGHPFDLATDVRYGIIGEPIPAGETGPAELAPQVPDEARRQLIEVFGPPFRIFRDKVQNELKLSDDQKQKLEDRLQEIVQDAMQFFQKLEGLKPEERDKELQAYRQQAHERLAAFLKEILKPEQLQRMRQLELQQEGPFALGRPDVMAEVNLDDAQRRRFMTLVQEMQRKIEPLIKEAQTAGNPEVIRPKAMAIRKEYAAKIESILTTSQQERWQKMLGRPFDFAD